MERPRTRFMLLVSVCYVLAAAAFGSVNLDGDERKFVIEPYQLMGGDYTRGYLAAGDAGSAVRCAAKSYFFYWYYRPMFAPIIEERHRAVFAPEEERFRYSKGESAGDLSEVTADRYKTWMVVPEPDRWYHHGAGKPLLPAVLTIPALGLVELATRGGPTLLDYQFSRNYHPIFILVRLPHLLAGLVSILLAYGLLRRQYGERKAVLGSAVFALFPLAIEGFPNLHHDAIMVPFLVATVADILKGRWWRAGIWYGLALASKNGALILLAALALVGAAKLVEKTRSGSARLAWAWATRVSRSALLFVLFALAALVPFANPVSYAKEALTPFIHRQYDPRGENVAQFTLSERLREPLPVLECQSRRRPEIVLLTHLGILSVAVFFIILALLLVGPRARANLPRLSMTMLLLALPYQVVFLPALNYRYLGFLPFFAFVSVDVVEERHLKWLIVFLVAVDAVMLIDPITVNTQHIMQGTATFWSAMLGR